MDFRYADDEGALYILSALLSFVVLLNMISTDVIQKKHHFNFLIITVSLRKKLFVVEIRIYLRHHLFFLASLEDFRGGGIGGGESPIESCVPFIVRRRPMTINNAAMNA